MVLVFFVFFCVFLCFFRLFDSFVGFLSFFCVDCINFCSRILILDDVGALFYLLFVLLVLAIFCLTTFLQNICFGTPQ